MIEWDVPKKRERSEAYWKFMKEKLSPVKQIQIDLNLGETDTISGDNTGHMVRLLDFEKIEDLGKLWNEPEFQMVWSEFALIVDNLSYRLGRSGIMKF